MIELEVKEMYGLNGKGVFKLTSDKRHNFVYGVNASGKSSIANSITHIVNKKRYEKRFPYDSDSFSIKLKFDDVNIEYSDVVNNIDNIIDLTRKVFVFNKLFIKNSLSISEGEGTSPEIGIRVVERSKATETINEIVENNVKEIKEKIKLVELPTTQKDLLDSSVFKNIYGRDTKSQEDSIKKISLFNTDQNIIEGLKSNDYYQNNIKLYKSFQNAVEKLNQEIVNSLSTKMGTYRYKITGSKDKDFYTHVISYLNTYSGSINCPICLETEIDVNKIIGEINDTLASLSSNDIVKSLSSIHDDVKDKDSYFAIQIKKIYESIMNFQFPVESIKNFNDGLKQFTENYDVNICYFSNIKINTDDIKSLDVNHKVVDDINKLNSSITNSHFIDEFDKMLEYIFKDDEIRAKSKLVGSTIVIQLSIKGKEKEEKTINEFFDIISESQKTKLSLAFFLALVTYKDVSSNILCVFDDPIDSYDSISKYQISRIIYEFIDKKNHFADYLYTCFSIFFSHSIDYFRLFIYNFRESQRKNNKYYVLSEIGLSCINQENLFVLDGDYNILNTIIHKRKNGEVKINELISIVPIIRELSNYSDNNFTITNFKLNINNNDIVDLNKYLSNNVIHGFDLKIELKELIDFLRKYVEFGLETHIYSDDEFVFDIIKKIINNSRKNQRDFYEEIILKNLLAIYIRAFYDSVLIKIIKNYVSSYQNKTMAEIKDDNDLWTINNKISVIHDDSNAWVSYKPICMEIAVNLTMLNDFAHSAGVYLTPLIDVRIEDLYKIFDDIDGITSIFESIKQLSYS